MAELVRVAALTGYFDVARQLGLDPLPLLRAAGLSRADAASIPEQMIPARAAIRAARAQRRGVGLPDLRAAHGRAAAASPTSA